MAELDRVRGEAGAGGRIVLVTGEAGAGRSTLVHYFAHRHADGGDVYVGLCDPLARSRPLGPLYDLARQIDGLTAILASPGQRTDVFAGVLDRLPRTRHRPVVVFEDVHWADDATLDLLAFLGRRLDRTRALIVLTYRDDELGPGHPLHTVLAGLPSERVCQLPVPPLSPNAVSALARKAGRRSEADLYAVTGGNPLLVTEVLSATGSGLSRKVCALAQAKLAGLSVRAQQLVRLVAVSPVEVELWLLAEASAADPVVAEECFSTGLLVPTDTGVGFRRELLRRAVCESLPSFVRREINRRILRILSTAPDLKVDPARLAHHAAECDDAAAVLRHAPSAARRAAAANAHLAAALHYETALQYAERLSVPDRAALLESVANHAFLAGDCDRALAASQTALAIWEAVGRAVKIGENLNSLARLYRWNGQLSEAAQAASRAVEVLEPSGPGRQLAIAYGNRAQLDALARLPVAAIGWGLRAMHVARHLHDPYSVANALIDLGTARLSSGDTVGRDDLDQAYTFAQEHGLVEEAARALSGIAVHGVEHRDFRRASSDLERALDLVTEYGLLGIAKRLTAFRAWLRLDQGDWTGAEDDSSAVLAQSEQPREIHALALIVLGRLRARRGEASAAEPLREAAAQAAETGELRLVALCSAARAEDAWLNSGWPDKDDLASAFEAAHQAGQPWYAGELAWWLRRNGADPPVSTWYAEPYRLLLNGDWRRAESMWAKLGCPYDQADALASSGEAGGGLRALELFDRLGARGAARRLRRSLRRLGFLRVPRGPRPTTMANPAGLTARQVEVLALVVAGMRNADIADRLALSVRTVDHHVAAVFTKLGVNTRRQAAAVASQLGIALAEDG